MGDKMRDKAIVKSLMNINFLYAYPALTSKYEKKEFYRKNPEAIYKKVGLRTHIVTFASLFLIYGFLFFMFNWKQMPFMLDLTLVVALIICICTQFTYFYNIIYENKDIFSYMSLPLEPGLVYRSKLLTALICGVDCVAIVPPLIFFFCFHNDYGIILSLVFAVVDSALFMAVVLALSVLIMYLLEITGLLRRFKQKVISAITVISSIVNVAYVLFLTYYSKKAMPVGLENIKPRYMALSRLLVSPFSHVILILVIGAVIFGFLYYIERDASKNFYRYIRQIKTGEGDGTKPGAKKKAKGFKAGKNLTASLIKYNMGLIGDSNIINVAILMPLMMPVIIFINVIIQGGNLRDIPIYFDTTGLGIGIGFVVGFMTVGAFGTLASLMISLEGEDHNYLKTLPLNYRQYAGVKLMVATLVSGVGPLLIALGLTIYMGLGPLEWILCIVECCAVMICGNCLWMIYDQSHLYIDWQNTSDILNRGHRMLHMALMVVLMIVLVTSLILLVKYPIISWILGGMTVVSTVPAVITWANFFKKPF